ncbi:unnamed protein product, partial [Effrenium voratum]
GNPQKVWGELRRNSRTARHQRSFPCCEVSTRSWRRSELSRDVHSIIHTNSVVGHLQPSNLQALREYVPLDRRAWLGPDIQRHLARQRRRRPFREALQIFQRRRRRLVKDSELPATAVGAVGGCALGSTGGGALGMLAGSYFGAFCGLVPALVTFGMSVPVGAVLGGAAGLVTGAAAGGTAGALGGGFLGRTAYAQQLFRSGADWALRFTGKGLTQAPGTGGTH